MTPSDLLEQVWPVFEAETREQLQALSSGVMEIEDASTPERTGPLLRLAHTIKGSAASVGASDIERLAHAVEDVLALAGDGRGLPGTAVEAVLRAAAAIEESLSAGALGRIVGRRSGARPAARRTPRGRHGGPGGRRRSPLRTTGRATSTCSPRRSARSAPPTAPSAPRARDGRARRRSGSPRCSPATPRSSRRAWRGRRASSRRAAAPTSRASSREPPRTWWSCARAPEPAKEPLAAKRSEERSIRVDAARLEEVAADVDQMVVGVSRRDRRGRDLQRLEQALREAALLLQRGLAEAGLREDARPRALSEAFDRVRNAGAELGRHGRELRGESDRERGFALALRDTLQDLRMVPAQTALDALRATVRDVAANLGKKVSLHLLGGEVRLDRRVLEEVKAPLLHLVRNALDHGIELPEARTAAGKAPEACLEVRVEARRDHVVITVRDDGVGLSPERLRAAAVQRGLVSPAEAGHLTDAEAAQLAFRPGISTASQVTALSGRGVGLDVVAEAARRLGGSVDVSFERGRGTSFVLEVPLTIAGASGVLFRGAGGLGIIPADAVERVLLVAPADIRTVAGQATVLVDGATVPFSSMAQALGTDGGPDLKGSTVALLVASGGKRVALAVDDVLGEHAIVVSPLGRRMSAVRHIAGATALDDGRVVAVLQPAHLLGAARAKEPGAAPLRPRIIVADDSLTTRTAAKALLEIAGFQVLPAADGEEALALARDPGCDLVVTDVQMPRLDGLDLTRRLKADPALARLPVILVTSLDAPEDRAAGLKAGADGYLVKREVQQGKLLELVRQLLPA